MPEPVIVDQSIGAACVAPSAPDAELTSTATPVTEALSAPPSESEPLAPAIFSADHLRVSPARTAAADGCRVATVSEPTDSDMPKDEVSVSDDSVNTRRRAPVRPFASTVLLVTLNEPVPPITSA